MDYQNDQGKLLLPVYVTLPVQRAIPFYLNREPSTNSSSATLKCSFLHKLFCNRWWHPLQAFLYKNFWGVIRAMSTSRKCWLPLHHTHALYGEIECRLCSYIITSFWKIYPIMDFWNNVLFPLHTFLHNKELHATRYFLHTAGCSLLPPPLMFTLLTSITSSIINGSFQSHHIWNKLMTSHITWTKHCSSLHKNSILRVQDISSILRVAVDQYPPITFPILLYKKPNFLIVVRARVIMTSQNLGSLFGINV